MSGEHPLQIPPGGDSSRSNAQLQQGRPPLLTLLDGAASAWRQSRWRAKVQLSGVHSQVHVELVLAGKTAATVGAHIELGVALVDLAVSHQVAALLEALSAVLAAIRALLRVGAQVDVHLLPPDEAHGTNMARVRFLPRVRLLVPDDVCLELGRVGAVAALEACLGPLGVPQKPVPVQVAAGGEALGAGVAGVHLVRHQCGRRPQLNPWRGGERQVV